MAAKTKKEPNLCFTGNEPLREIKDGKRVYRLPKNQKKRFYHKNAKQIAALFPHLYQTDCGCK